MILAPNGRPARQQLRSQGLGYAFDAAKRSGYKAWFYFPSLDPSDQIVDWTREEIAKKLNWLYNNCPAASAAIDGLADEEADTGIWPSATTSNPAFNKAVTDLFDNDCGDARFFDEAGVENVYTQASAIRRNIYMLHEMFGQLLRPGEGTNIPTLHTIPSWQVGNRRSRGASGFDQKEWIDGTRANDRGRVFQYRVFTNKSGTETRDIDAGDMLHFHDALWKGQRRGMSPLTPAVRKFFSLDDLDRAANSGELMRQRVAYQITKSQQDDDEPTLIPGATLVETVESENPDGTKTRLHIQRITSQDGTDIDIADLPPGREIKMVESTKGGAAIEWSESVLTDIARCTKYPPVYVFFLGGLVQGTEVRMVNKRIQRRKNIIRQNQLIPQFCKRWYNFWLWQSILRGRFDGLAGGVPQDWYKHRWNVPPDDSVDIGREGRLFDDRLDSGKMTLRAYHAVSSEAPEDVEDEIIADRVRRLKKIEDARAALEDRAPDYTRVAHLIEYDLIFRESKSVMVAPEPGDDELPAPVPANQKSKIENRKSISRPGGTSMNGHHSRV